MEIFELWDGRLELELDFLHGDGGKELASSSGKCDEKVAETW